VSNTSAALQDVASVDDFLNVAATETVPLFEHLDFGFLLEYDVFAPACAAIRTYHLRFKSLPVRCGEDINSSKSPPTRRIVEKRATIDMKIVAAIYLMMQR
jgi:hypothetical protein